MGWFQANLSKSQSCEMAWEIQRTSDSSTAHKQPLSAHVFKKVFKNFFFGCARSFLQYTGSFSFGAQALECAGSVVVMPMLSFPVAYGTLVPIPRIKPTTPALEDRFLTTGPPGKFPKFFFSYFLQ